MFKMYQEQREANIIVSPSNGTFVELTEVPDPLFSQGLVGNGFAVIPADGIVKAPVSGKIVTTAESKHLVGIKTEDNYVVLIHVGIGTAILEGEGFEYLIAGNQTVKKGQDILKFDLDFVKEKAHSSLIVTTITNAPKNKTVLLWNDDVTELVAGETPVVNVIIR
ncbi:hypothetical protein Ccar_05315 [Clostridium carboxidivorans P7]|uniref:PTS system, glucose subfamily, IIA subunit n=1 Tax=Clostridium carboxidivorans P7 TaxID=536227 RepID=C6PSW0_9CLOT|nr:glucose PTS transporter subunit IIA [Clostridium carboxidivorans]AKN30274.1 hypothetical protein Ccar_05315 [Clostridium carboxidivorans P7]EET87699.1 PTS system, glucose subfamily, IIA subunit [Clostridium carboxidivorans P7]